MKRVICIVLATLVLISMFATVAFAKHHFVPSIPYKDSPTIVPVRPRPGPGGSEQPGGPGTPEHGPVAEIVDKKKGEVVKYVYHEHIVVTPVSEAESSTEIPKESKDKLLEVYDKLDKGEMEIPYEKIDPSINVTDVVIRDLFDVTIVSDEHKEVLVQENMTIVITFDLGVAADVDVYCMVYVEDEWIPAASVTNNGDGTVTVALDNTGPVTFSVKTGDMPPAQTGDTVGADLPVWIGVMAAAGFALILLLVLGNRKKTH